jgi:hypothetical protein
MVDVMFMKCSDSAKGTLWCNPSVEAGDGRDSRKRERGMSGAHLERLNAEQRRAVEHGIGPGNARPGGPLL